MSHGPAEQDVVLATISMEQGDGGSPEESPKPSTASGPVSRVMAETPNPQTTSCAARDAHPSQRGNSCVDPAVLEWMVQAEDPSGGERWQVEGLIQALPQPVHYYELLWRDWEDLCDPEAPGSDLFDFTVLSYNILAQDLVVQNPELYWHCAPTILAWAYRWQNILQELQHWEADILCLQEVQEDHYREHVLPSLSAMGYSCHYKRRTGRKTDGCCTCFKTHRFSLLSESHVEYFRPGVDTLNRDNVGLLLLLNPLLEEPLKDKYSPRPVCVANTHLLYNPRRGDIKLAQLALLLAEIDRVSRAPEGSHYPVILCGDLNATPDSPLYRLLRSGMVTCENLPTWKVSGQEKKCPSPYPRMLPSRLWPEALGINHYCQYGAPSAPDHSDRLMYSRQQLLQLRYCDCALQRPTDLPLIKGVTDNEPGLLAESADDFPPVSSPDAQTPGLRPPTVLRHSLHLTSAYSHFLPAKGRPEVTTIPGGVGSTVDYICYSAEPIPMGSMSHGVRFYQDKELRLLGRLCLLSEDDLWAAHGLPNPFCSSDHLCLLARFGLDLSAS
ncbi:protein angel homolog 1 [Spea bombifrons]|uniref:protein angel homolog 1 n=1 Tax=Spea bombifrons TaxID=233779 RepID=UPI00234915E3|nr:protein angel homolog 1 [Spea bombifrons]